MGLNSRKSKTRIKETSNSKSRISKSQMVIILTEQNLKKNILELGRI